MTRNPKVLIVDDEEDLHVLFSVAFELEDIEVASAYDGREAIEVAEASRPDFILLDLMMPRVDGWECLERLKQHPRLCRVPVAVFTGRVSEETRLRAAAMGADMVSKPTDITALIEMIRDATDRLIA